jgi:hypothetical protein
MSTRSQKESRLLGVVFGLVIALAITVPLALLPIFGDDDSESSSTQSDATPATTTVAQAAGGGNGGGNGNGAGGNGNGGVGNGNGNGNGGGGNGSGPGSGNGPGNGEGQVHLEDPLSQGVASEEVAATFASGGCVACHNIKGIGGGAARLGPGLSQAGFIASERRPGYEALDYLEESILNPGAFVRTNCPDGPCIDGLMPQTYSETLTSDEISTIVNYLASLGTAAEADVLFAP